MSQFIFGAGNMYVTQKQDAQGNAIANPTPYPLMVLQEGSIDFSAESKELYGQNQFPVAVGRGKAKMQIKVKPGRIFANVWNAIYFGQTVEDGLIAIHTETAGVAIPDDSAYEIDITPPSSGIYAADMGVIDWNGQPMKRVATTPSTGEYSVDVAAGTYAFATADAGKVVYINYQYSASVSGAKKQTVKNLPMGYAPTFSADLCVSYLGKIATFSFPMAISSKFSIGLKNEDFAIPEFEFSAFDPGNGSVMSWSTSE